MIYRDRRQEAKLPDIRDFLVGCDVFVCYVSEYYLRESFLLTRSPASETAF